MQNKFFPLPNPESPKLLMFANVYTGTTSGSSMFSLFRPDQNSSEQVEHEINALGPFVCYLLTWFLTKELCDITSVRYRYHALFFIYCHLIRHLDNVLDVLIS